MNKYYFKFLLLLLLVTFGNLTTAYSAVNPRVFSATASSTSRTVHPKVSVYKLLKLISRTGKFRKSKNEYEDLKLYLFGITVLFVVSIILGVWAINLFVASKILLGLIVLLVSLVGLFFSLRVLGPIANAILF